MPGSAMAAPRPLCVAGSRGFGRRVPLSCTAVQYPRTGGVAGGRSARIAAGCLRRILSGAVAFRGFCWLQFRIPLKRAGCIIEGSSLFGVFPVSLLPLVALMARESAQLDAFQIRQFWPDRMFTVGENLAPKCEIANTLRQFVMNAAAWGKGAVLLSVQALRQQCIKASGWTCKCRRWAVIAP